MRLINVNNYSVSEFTGRNVPPYAILSHTWGDDEVSFKDIQNPNAARPKGGFKKIDFCCKQAKGDNFEWVWVDTCCIDKTSSAELSEAINSMFRWYSEAMACYAYLSDVLISYDDRLENFDLDSFRQSRWFTRGWTLQELIAPLRVQFFTSSWSYIGSKKQLAPLLSEITGIPRKILDHWQSPLAQPVYDRMHWASRRQTTREEDMAYCLFGLFDVNLPLLYGEGKKSFHRLQEEIIRQFGDNTIFIWDVHPTRGLPEGGEMLVRKTSVFAGLLAESPHQFSNRCTVKKVYRPEMRMTTSQSIQISRQGLQMKLYLKNVAPNRIPSWPRFAFPVDGIEHTCYLAALSCIILDKEYVTGPDIINSSNCTAMLLVRRSDGTYERVLSYYETVSLHDVIRNWEYAECHIGYPSLQSWDSDQDWNSELDMQISFPSDKLNMRWAGPTFGYSVIEEFTNRSLSLFLLEQNSKPPYGLYIVVVCSTQPHSTLLDVIWQEDWRDISKINLEELASNYFRPQLQPFVRSGIGPIHEEAFCINDKELVLTLSIEDAFNGPSPLQSRRVRTLWLSFRPLVNRSISDAVLKAMLYQNSGAFDD